MFPWKPFKVPDIDCSKLFEGEKQELERAKQISRRKIPDSDVTDEVRKGCHVFRANNGFITSSLTAAERNFPIAYSIVVFKDAAQVCLSAEFCFLSAGESVLFAKPVYALM